MPGAHPVLRGGVTGGVAGRADAFRPARITSLRLVTTVRVVGVGLTRAGLGQPTADEICPGHNRYVEPGLTSDELIGAARVPAVDDGGADKDADDHSCHRPELSRLESLLGLCRKATSETDLRADLRRGPAWGLGCSCFHT